MYGEAQTNERHKTWNLLKFIKSSSALPWVCIGDFNEVLDRSEHVGVQECRNAQMEGFTVPNMFEGRNCTYEKKRLLAVLTVGFVWIEL